MRVLKENIGILSLFCAAVIVAIVWSAVVKIKGLQKDVEIRDSLLTESLRLDKYLSPKPSIIRAKVAVPRNNKRYCDTLILWKIRTKTDTIIKYVTIKAPASNSKDAYSSASYIPDLLSEDESKYLDTINYLREKLLLAENLFCDATGYDQFKGEYGRYKGRVILKPFDVGNFKTLNKKELEIYKEKFAARSELIDESLSSYILLGEIRKRFSNKVGEIDDQLYIKIGNWNERIKKRKEREKERYINREVRLPN